MPIQLLIAPPAAGKTQTCIQAVHDTQAADPLARIWILVRDRLQAAYFRRRLAESGGCLGARVETFQNLYREALECSGGQVRPLANRTLHFQIMRASIQNAGLEYYSPIKDLPGFTTSMARRIAELQRGFVRPEQLDDPAFSRSVRELGRLYPSFQRALEATGWDTQETAAWRAVEALQSDPDLLSCLDLVIVDGFDWFDPAQLKTILLLEGRVRRMLVTLPGRSGMKRSLERGFARSYQAFKDQPGCEEISLSSSPHLPPALAYLEQVLLENGSRPFEDPVPQLDLVEARSPAEEAREALRWMKRWLLRDPNPPKNCAVLVPDPELYEPFLRAAAAEFGLPLRFSHEQRLASTPTAGALINLLGLPASGYPRRGLMDVLRSPFFDLAKMGLDRRQVDVLDLVSRYGKVIEGLDQWQEVFDVLVSQPALEPRSIVETEGEDTPGLPALPVGEDARSLAAAFQRFAATISPPALPLSLKDWVAWLENLLSCLGFYPAPNSPVSGEERAVLDALGVCMQEMIAADEVMAARQEHSLAFEDFRTEFQAAMEWATCVDEPSSHPGAISVLRILDARGVRFEIAALLGLSEGSFPRVERPDPLLDEAARRQLGVEPRLEQDQLGSFYQALARGDRALLLSRPYLAESGDPWEPSPFWTAVADLFPGLVRRVRPEDALPLADAASPDEALFFAVRRAALTQQGLPEGQYTDLIDSYTWVTSAQTRLAALLKNETLSTGQEQNHLTELSADRFGPQHAWSISRLESYAACPFRFYLENVLKVEAHQPPDWDLDAAQLGSLLHEILEETYRGATDPRDMEQMKSRLKQAAGQAFETAPGKYGFRPSPLWDEARSELLGRLEETVTGLAALDGDWEPIAFEQAFGFDGQPALEIELGNARISLHGVIDRIDRNPQGQIRVIDYKTGGSHLGKADLVSGRRIQLAVYALAAREALKLGDPAEGFYWKIGKDGNQSSIKLSKFSGGGTSGPHGALALAQDHIGDLVQRIAAGYFQTAPLDGECASYCPAAPWCWQYEAERHF